MSYPQIQTVSLTTSTGGLATGYTDVIRGQIAAVKYTKAGSSPFASTADITVTLEDSGQTVMTWANINTTTTTYPVAPATKASGAASTITESPIYAVGERLKVAVAQGGNTKVGTVTVVWA